nr:MAG TPA: hypothetical protein [Bacteriophage sp.]
MKIIIPATYFYNNTLVDALLGTRANSPSVALYVREHYDDIVAHIFLSIVRSLAFAISNKYYLCLRYGNILFLFMN